MRLTGRRGRNKMGSSGVGSAHPITAQEAAIVTTPSKESIAAIPEDLGTLYGELSGGARTSCSRTTALGLIERLGRAETALRDLIHNGGPAQEQKSCGHLYQCVCP